MFSTPPLPLTPLEKRLLIGATVAVALTRLLAISRGPWEWDEMLFSSAVRSYNVMDHHPHPPGFPLFIAMAKGLAAAGASDFHALQLVVLAGAVLLFPLSFLIARQLKFPFASAFCGALILCFAPNVWYYGGTGFSDVPTLAVVLAASLLLLRGCRSSRDYLAGALLVGVAFGMRPQSVLVPAVPLLVASVYAWRRRGVEVAAAAAVLAVVAVASYTGAGLASGTLQDYTVAVEKQERYVREVDSWQSPTRPPLPSLFRTFFKSTRGVTIVDKVIAVSALLSLAVAFFARRRGPWLLVLMFGPLNVFSWLMLDFTAASRYTIAYAPMYAVLAADGMWAATLPLSRHRRRIAALALMVTALCGSMIAAAVPALNEVRSSFSPVVAATHWIEANLPREGVRIFATEGMEPFTTYYLRGWNVVVVLDTRELPPAPSPHDWFLVDRSSKDPRAANFLRRHGVLWDIARQRYFEASVAPMAGR